MKIYTKIKSFFSQLFHLSVTRKEVLEYAKYYYSHDNSICTSDGLCTAICRALFHYGIDVGPSIIYLLFPLFDVKNAIRFGANKYSAYWWDPGIWNTGRKDFLNWLIERYKDDTTNLKKEVRRLRL